MASFNYVPLPGDAEEVRKELQGEFEPGPTKPEPDTTPRQPQPGPPNVSVAPPQPMMYGKFRTLPSPRRRAWLKKQVRS